MPGPLHGYRVVDLTSNVAGPLGTMILGDQGADIIKVEAPDGGDATRAGSNRRAGFTASFLNNNRNKRSIVLDLKTAAGLRVMMRLVAGADVLVQNFRPGVAERLGVGEDTVRAVSPKIVYVSISGFGEKGPYAEKPAYDPGLLGAGAGPGGLRRSAPATVSHNPARQIDRDHRLPGDHCGTPGARTLGRRPACPLVNAGSSDGVPVELGYGRPDFCRRG